MDKVLLINDSKFEAMVLCDLLDSLGYEAKATSEFEALLQVKVFEPNIVIANLIMKTIRGDELIEKIKTYDKEIKCILSSSNDISLGDFLKKKVDVVLHTPTTKDTLEHILDTLNNMDILNSRDLLVLKSGEDEKTKKTERTVVTKETKEAIKTEDKTLKKTAEEKVLESGKMDTSVIKEAKEVEKKKMAFCPFCGNKLPTGLLSFVFCPSCGQKL